ncbi:chaperonin 10-like protein [Mycena galericulata]|nr:chaperonin 10-like protein [Mycena galericulata]
MSECPGFVCQLRNHRKKALVIKEEKAPFTLETIPIPIPGVGQILIKIKAAALNPVDWKQQKYGLYIEKYPAVLGWDIAGDVEELGEGVQGYSKGERVFALAHWTNGMSSFQQYAVIPSDILGKIPQNIDYAQAATIPLGYATAAVGLLASLPAGAGLNPTFDPAVNFSGQVAFVFGGSSSVGQFALQVLRVLGYTIITYASGKHTEYLKSLGATHVIDRRTVSTADVPAAVKKIAGAPIKIVYDAISEEAHGQVVGISPCEDTKEACFEIVSDGGIAVAVLPGEEKNVDGKRSISIFGSTHIHREFGVLLWKTLPKQVADGVIVRRSRMVSPVTGIVDGLKKMENNLVSGVKLVVFPQETI